MPRGASGRGGGMAIDPDAFFDDPPTVLRRGAVDADPARIGVYSALGCALSVIGAVVVLALLVMWVGASFASFFQGWGSAASACSRSTDDLIRAAYAGDEPKVRALLEQGADPNHKDDRGKTAVVCAAEGGNFPTTMTLLHHGADAEGLSKPSRHTLMFFEIDHDDDDEVAFLLDHNVDPDDSLDALAAEAASGKHLRVLQELIRRGADDEAALRAAVDSGTFETTKLLLDAGANPSGVSTNGTKTYTPLLRATFDQRGDLVELLLNAGADPNDGGSLGRGDFELAAKVVGDRNPNSRLFLLDPNTLTFPGNLPPLAAAAANGDALMVTRLLQAHADPNRVGFDRLSPLHGAVLGGSAAIVKTLLDSGAVPTPAIAPGAPSPRDLALFTNQPDVAAALDAATPK